ncbi:NYN domain-containing protein [Sinorhizobium mexicanum]|uniref:NYN domain-containing protein n=1 Tax=Sinorhizobium mexicanum TaxID=375549 RepID=UPI001DDD15F0|nr:hypothetical protein [Sinorhizobium mexicanum]
MANDTVSTLALLIEGDNASPKIIAGLLAEIASYGRASVKRVYGDWTRPNLNGWKKCLLSIRSSRFSSSPHSDSRCTVDITSGSRRVSAAFLFIGSMGSMQNMDFWLGPYGARGALGRGKLRGDSR